MSDNKTETELDDINSSKEHKQNLAENSTEDKSRKDLYVKEGLSTSEYWRNKVIKDQENQNKKDNTR